MTARSWKVKCNYMLSKASFSLFLAADEFITGKGDPGNSDRALVHLYYYENRGLAEIEGILGVGRDALKMRLARARKRLRQLWRSEAPMGTIDEAD